MRKLLYYGVPEDKQSQEGLPDDLSVEFSLAIELNPIKYGMFGLMMMECDVYVWIDSKWRSKDDSKMWLEEQCEFDFKNGNDIHRRLTRDNIGLSDREYGMFLIEIEIAIAHNKLYSDLDRALSSEVDRAVKEYGYSVEDAIAWVKKHHFVDSYE